VGVSGVFVLRTLAFRPVPEHGYVNQGCNMVAMQLADGNSLHSGTSPTVFVGSFSPRPLPFWRHNQQEGFQRDVFYYRSPGRWPSRGEPGLARCEWRYSSYPLHTSLRVELTCTLRKRLIYAICLKPFLDGKRHRLVKSCWNETTKKSEFYDGFV